MQLYSFLEKERKKKEAHLWAGAEIDLVIKKKGKMLSLVICLLHFFSMHYFVGRRGRLGG